VKKKPLNLPMIIALVLAVIGGYTFWQMDKKNQARFDQMRAENEALREKNNVPPPPPPTANNVATKKVLVAAIPIPANKELSESDFKLVDVPANLYPNAVTDAKSILFEADPNKPGDQRLSRNLALRPFAVNEPIERNFIGKRLERLESRIRPGMRVLSLQNVNDLSGGIVEDGSLVDLLFVYNDPSLGERTTLVAQNLKVLLNGNQPDPRRQDPNFRQYEPNNNPSGIARPGGVVFEVTPDQAQVFSQLSRSGSYSMIVRNPEDNVVVNIRGIAKNEIINNPKVVQSRSLKSILQTEEVRKTLEQKKQEMNNATATP
jgi:Flp pilus assembly protein CpaB